MSRLPMGRAVDLPDTVRRAVADLLDRALDRALRSPLRISSYAEGEAMLDRGADDEVLAEQIQRVAMLLAPFVATARVLRRVPGVRRVPFVVPFVTAASIATVLRHGVRELQVVSSFLTHRFESELGHAPDPRLVKHLTVELYVGKGRADLRRDRAPRIQRMLVAWLLRGVQGRDTGRHARRALQAVARMNPRAAARAWEESTLLGR